MLGKSHGVCTSLRSKFRTELKFAGRPVLIKFLAFAAGLGRSSLGPAFVCNYTNSVGLPFVKRWARFWADFQTHYGLSFTWILIYPFRDSDSFNCPRRYCVSAGGYPPIFLAFCTFPKSILYICMTPEYAFLCLLTMMLYPIFIPNWHKYRQHVIKFV